MDYLLQFLVTFFAFTSGIFAETCNSPPGMKINPNPFTKGARLTITCDLTSVAGAVLTVHLKKYDEKQDKDVIIIDVCSMTAWDKKYIYDGRIRATPNCNKDKFYKYLEWELTDATAEDTGCWKCVVGFREKGVDRNEVRSSSLQLRTTPVTDLKTGGNSEPDIALLVAIPLVLIVIIVIVCILIWWVLRKRKQKKQSERKSNGNPVTYEDVDSNRRARPKSEENPYEIPVRSDKQVFLDQHGRPHRIHSHETSDDEGDYSRVTNVGKQPKDGPPMVIGDDNPPDYSNIDFNRKPIEPSEFNKRHIKPPSRKQRYHKEVTV